MDALARELEDLYGALYISFRNALATVTGSRESARDAVQEAFARALAGRERHREGACLAAWVWKIAYRLALEERRKSASPLGEHAVTGAPAAGARPRARRRAAPPPPRRRLIVFLRYFGDFSYAEIAEACDVSEGTVAAALAQARAELRASLEPEGAAR